MVTFKTKLDYKQYFLGSFYKMTRGVIDKLFLIFFFCGSILYFIIELPKYGIIFICMPIIFFLGIPLLKYLYAKIYFKMDFIEYFFNQKTFGYTIGDYKLEFKKERIVELSFYDSYIFIQIPKQKLFFIGESEEINKVKKNIQTLGYKIGK